MLNTQILIIMRNTAIIAAITLLSSVADTDRALAQTMDRIIEVGGQPMLPSKNIVENAVNSRNHTTLVAAVKAAELAGTLQGPGPFTVFAPTNDAFENLPNGTVSELLKPENKKSLTNVLTYHVIAGKISASDLIAAIKKGNGKYSVKAVNGGMLTFSMNGSSNVMVWDENGNGANISIYDVNQSNGVIHVVDAVLLPKM
jgi:uncharacterized surface protein with fasciclin (FAS1) repeats